ncbi:MAG: NAD(P)-dependent dehydrogenase, short-chain alcohol dehydrogenase family [Pedobacter sp.]|jgi:NAD(P)-dependent dehydrogenase (short-subunit alcohol dehydrogenase family)|nr:NAD(P)-dependent dehydrogenase, short-chain alcohol dehydrogenase family [Pedobacter sp.]
MKKFENKIAVITGGNSGMGYGTAKLLKELGATVIITGRRKEAIEQAAKELGVQAILSDQGKLEDIDSLVTEVTQKFGKVDILFINAGISGTSSIELETPENFDKMMNVNFRGVFFTLNKFIPYLNDGASVVILSSVLASTVSSGLAVYSASKAAINSIMKTAALELAPRKIRVNAISPGAIDTELFSKMGMDDKTLAGMTDYLISLTPIGRIGKPEEIGQLVAFLSSDEASFITGSDHTIDGGSTLL